MDQIDSKQEVCRTESASTIESFDQSIPGSSVEIEMTLNSARKLKPLLVFHQDGTISGQRVGDYKMFKEQ